MYARISADRAGAGLGVERQRADCVDLAGRRGYALAGTYVDNDISAYSGKLRPQYRRLLASVSAGDVDVVLAWHPDRLHRSPVELEEFIAVVEGAGATVETVQAGRWDLSTPSGRFVARQLGGVARYESEHKSERVRRALEQNAARGKTHGPRPYGWTRVYDADGAAHEHLHDVEAAVVRDVARRIVAGESLRSITAGLNAAGVPSPRGRQWEKGMVRHVVLRERNAGLRVHRGQVVGEGDWPALLEHGAYEQVRAVLADPARRTAQSTAAVHLLSGIARCGVCGGPMRASQNRSVPSYRCAERSCVSRNRRDVDEMVTRLVLGYLAHPDAAALLRPDSSADHAAAAEEARGLRARLDTAADDYADGKIDSRQLERITARIRPALAAADARVRTIDDAPLLEGLVANDLAAAVWERLPLSRRRGVVDLLVTVSIDRARRGQRTFDPGSVRITWR